MFSFITPLMYSMQRIYRAIMHCLHFESMILHSCTDQCRERKTCTICMMLNCRQVWLFPASVSEVLKSIYLLLTSFVHPQFTGLNKCCISTNDLVPPPLAFLIAALSVCSLSAATVGGMHCNCLPLTNSTSHAFSCVCALTWSQREIWH